MKSKLTLFLVCAAGFITSLANDATGEDNKKIGVIKIDQEVIENSAWVAKCLKDFRALKPDMTRRQIEQRLERDGGVQRVGILIRYAHPACPYFKIDIEFEVERDTDGRALEGKEDRVTKVSKPYLEAPHI